MRVSGFLDHRDGKMKLNKYEIKVLPINSNNSQMIKAVCTESMFKYQREEFKVRCKNNDFSQNLPLADASFVSEANIDIFIGADF